MSLSFTFPERGAQGSHFPVLRIVCDGCKSLSKGRVPVDEEDHFHIEMFRFGVQRAEGWREGMVRTRRSWLRRDYCPRCRPEGEAAESRAGLAEVGNPG